MVLLSTYYQFVSRGLFSGHSHLHASVYVLCSSPFYEIKENSVIVKCTIAGSKIVLRCKIWPTPKNFGFNKVEASLNGAFLWKKGLWWYNARSSREFIIGDDIKLIAEWHVTLRTNWDALPPNDPRRNQGPFCIEYLAIKDEHKSPLIEYLGDRSPLISPYVSSCSSLHLSWFFSKCNIDFSSSGY